MACRSDMKVGDIVYPVCTPQKYAVVIEVIDEGEKHRCNDGSYWYEDEGEWKILNRKGEEEIVRHRMMCLNSLKEDAERKAKTHKTSIANIKKVAKQVGILI